MQNKVASCLYLFLEHCTLLAVERTGRCSPLGWPWLTWRCCLQQQPLYVLLILWGMEQWTKLVTIMLKIWQNLINVHPETGCKTSKSMSIIFRSDHVHVMKFLSHIYTFCKTRIILLTTNLVPLVKISVTRNEMPIFILHIFSHLFFPRKKKYKFYLRSINKSGLSIYN
jgi:hypothetical protein